MTALSSYLLRNKRWVYFALSFPIILSAIYQTIHYYIIPLRYIAWSRLHLVNIPFVEALLLFGIMDWLGQSQQGKKTTLWHALLVFSSFNLILTVLLVNYYSVHAVQEASLVIMAVRWGPIFRNLFAVLSFIAFVVAARDPFNVFFQRLTQDLGMGDASPDENGVSRRIAAIIFIALFAVGLGLRLYNIDGFPPHIDEYAHIRVAESLLNGVPNDYERAFATVTVPVYLSFAIFGTSLWAARLPLALISMAGMLPAYFLGKRINKQVGLTVAGLLALSPWAIAAARTVRDYAILPIFFYTCAICLLELLDWDGLTPVEYIKKKAIPLALSFFILAYVFMDILSVLRIILLQYVIFGTLLILRLLKSAGAKRYILPIFFVVLLLFLLVVRVQYRLYRVLFDDGMLIYQATSNYWKMTVSDNLAHWYSFGDLGYVFLSISGVLILFILLKPYTGAGFMILFVVGSFSAILVYLTFFLITPFVTYRARYGVLSEYWYIPLVGIAIWLIFRQSRRYLPGFRPELIALLLAVLFINARSISDIVNYDGGGFSPVVENPHYDVVPALDFLATVLTDRDVLLSDVVFRYDQITEKKFSPTTRTISYSFSNDFSPFAVVDEYPRGWIAVSRNVRPEDDGLLYEDVVYKDVTLHYVGRKGEIYIWRWNKHE